MQCPNCQRENESTNRFCIFCGSPLLAPEVEQPSEPAQASPDALLNQQLALQEEVRRLRELVVLMNERLATLEHTRGIAIPSSAPTAAAVPAGSEPVTVPSAEAPPSPPRKIRLTKVREREWEQILGGNWLARVGVLALIIGAAFFLKFAFDNNWIGPNGRVILGIVGGLTMLWGGYRWQRRYPVLAQAISGGGIAILYLSIFASFATYQLIGLYPAFGTLFLVSVASAGLAIWYNSMALVIIGILGAFMAPFMLGAFGPGGAMVGDGGRAVQLIAYVVVVDLGVLALSTFRNWRWLTLLALFSSLVAFGVLHDEFRHEAGLLTFQVGITLIFLIFVGATTLFHIIWRRAPQSFDQSLMVINAGAYFGISLGLLWDDFRLWMGGFTLLLALFYGGLAYVALKRSADNVRLSFVALVIALVLVTAAIPVQLGNTVWTTITWAAEGAVLIWLSLTFRMPQLRWYSYIVFTIMAVRLLFFDTPVDIHTFRPILNERFLAFLVSIAALYLAGYLLLRERKRPRESKVALVVFLIAANFFSLWVLSAEVLNYFGSHIAALLSVPAPSPTPPPPIPPPPPVPDYEALRSLRSAQSLSLTAVWALYAVILLVVGIVKRWRPVRLGALALLVVAIGKVFVYDVFTLQMAYRIAAFVGLGFLLLASAYLYQRYSKNIKGFLVEK